MHGCRGASTLYKSTVYERSYPCRVGAAVGGMEIEDLVAAGYCGSDFQGCRPPALTRAGLAADPTPERRDPGVVRVSIYRPLQIGACAVGFAAAHVVVGEPHRRLAFVLW